MPDKMKRRLIYPEDSSWDPGNRKMKQIGCTGRRASLTLEAALTVPLFLLAWLAVICVMDIYRIQAEVKTSLSESARELGMYAAAAQGEGQSPVDVISTAACILYGRQKLPDLGDQVQISLLRSSYQDSTVTLRADIFYTLPVGFGPWQTILLKNTASAGAWTGDDGNRGLISGEGGCEEMVYITETESVYHTSASCTHIHLSSMREPCPPFTISEMPMGRFMRAVPNAMGTPLREPSIIRREGIVTTAMPGAAD